MALQRRDNPFAPGPGKAPPVLVGREQILSDFDDALYNQNFDSTGMLLTGPRGIGKTVLLDALKEVAMNEGWTVIRTSAVQKTWKDDLAAEMIRKYLELVPDKGQARLASITIPLVGGGFALDRDESTSPSTTKWPFRAVLRLLAEAVENGVTLLIDEAQASDIDDLRALGDDFQILLESEKLPITIALAALPQLNKEIERDHKDATFLQRLDRRSLARLTDDEVQAAVVGPLTKEGIHISDEVAAAIVAAVKGGPYFSQLFGSELWARAARDGLDTITEAIVADLVPRSRAKYGKNVVHPQLDELSTTDKSFLLAMAMDDGDSSLASIAERLDRTTNHISQYRLRLIEAGLIMATGPTKSGTFAIMDPQMKEDIRDLFEYKEFVKQFD